LMKLLPPEDWTGFSHRLVIHGRQVCHVRQPECPRCNVNRLCPSADL
jgi:endonuclease-3